MILRRSNLVFGHLSILLIFAITQLGITKNIMGDITFLEFMILKKQTDRKRCVPLCARP